MKAKKPRTSGNSAAHILPPLYKDTAVLSFDQHSGKALKPFNGFGFSAATPVVPLMLGEFAHAARFYPILFTAGDRPTPVALLGLKERQNLFVEPDC
ncbi:MAG: SapC family protein [Rhizobiaceae bacterium]|nr:SapC family protein [Rhizobiaceae bacterium]